jgi:hypothetical protein
MHSISELTIGRVFELYKDDMSRPPKPKLSVVVGLTDDGSEFATVYINTLINMNFINKPELESLQVEIEPGPTRSFIKHTSYIDCSALKTRFPGSVIDEINNSNGKMHGLLPREDIKCVIELLQKADSIPSYYKKLYNITPTQ